MGIPKNLRQTNTTRHISLKKEDGGITQNTQEITQQWEDWGQKISRISPEKESPEILHIPERTCEQIDIQMGFSTDNETENKTIHIPTGLQQIRTQSKLREQIVQNPKIHQMLTEPYTPQEIKNAIKSLKNRKAYGADGTPGGIYKEIREWIIQPLTTILQKIQQGQQLPPRMETRSSGTHIQKQRRCTGVQKLQTNMSNKNII